ncbi:jmjC domain-containing protein 8 isoform X2 [Macrotis lagotis]|uniref:jmjC domain-containing protein 8 isoform X2 n=1 Tax=Macrotis lagotis TaxID=92651 RepID=UPI003D692E1E
MPRGALRRGRAPAVLGMRLLILALAALARPAGGTSVRGGWDPSGRPAPEEEEPCTVDRRAELTYADFIRQYAFSRPVILQRLTNNSLFRDLCSREKLLAEFGAARIRLSTANTHSYHKVDLPFQDYVEQLLRPQDPRSLGNDTLYFFGDNNFTEWGRLLRHYSPPPFRLLGTTAAYSFGIAGIGSGVPFHWHGPGYSEVIFGRKRRGPIFTPTKPPWPGYETHTRRSPSRNGLYSVLSGLARCCTSLTVGGTPP